MKTFAKTLGEERGYALIDVTFGFLWLILMLSGVTQAATAESPFIALPGTLGRYRYHCPVQWRKRAYPLPGNISAGKSREPPAGDELYQR